MRVRMPWTEAMSWLKKGIGSPRPVILKSNFYQKAMFEKCGFLMETIQSIILCKLLWRVMHTAIVSLMPTIWRCVLESLMLNGRIKDGSVIGRKKWSIALNCGHQRLRKLNCCSINLQTRMRLFGRACRWHVVNKNLATTQKILKVFGF